MSALVDFVVLSLLPLHWQRDIAERLRAGGPPGDIFEQMTAERALDGSARFDDLPARALAAMARALDAGIDAISWNDPALSFRARRDCRSAAGALAAWRAGVARSASRRDRRIARRFAVRARRRRAARVRSGVARPDVVSGLARGVDSAAHRGALAASRIHDCRARLRRRRRLSGRASRARSRHRSWAARS